MPWLFWVCAALVGAMWGFIAVQVVRAHRARKEREARLRVLREQARYKAPPGVGWYAGVETLPIVVHRRADPARVQRQKDEDDAAMRQITPLGAATLEAWFDPAVSEFKGGGGTFDGGGASASFDSPSELDVDPTTHPSYAGATTDTPSSIDTSSSDTSSSDTSSSDSGSCSPSTDP